MDGLDGIGLGSLCGGWDGNLCVGLLYEHRFAVLIMMVASSQVLQPTWQLGNLTCCIFTQEIVLCHQRKENDIGEKCEISDSILHSSALPIAT